MAKFFYIPFASVSGDTATTPDSPQANGSVSYSNGYGPFYQLPLPSGGNAIAINRQQFNGLMNDITLALNVIQSQGINSWIGLSPTTPPDYSGNFPYPINALVYYTDGNIYQSLIANNTDTPPSANWTNISLYGGGGVPIGASIDFMGLLPPTNYLLEDGTAYSRTTYAKLLAAITLTLTGTTTGTSPTVTMSNTAGIQPGLIVEGTGIPASTTVLSVIANTSITLSANATASGTVPLTFFAWGNGDGSTTFNVPDSRRRVSMGSGGTGSAVVGNAIGNVGGLETTTLLATNLPPHTHALPQNFAVSNAATGTARNASNGVTQLTDGGQGLNSTPFNNVQPSIVVTKCIRYQ